MRIFCKHLDLIVQRNNGERWVTCTNCHTDFLPALPQDRLAEIRSRWEVYDAKPQCEDWWYSAIRHCQRNVDSLCEHQAWPEPDEFDTDQPDVHPDRYDGAAYAHSASDIHYLLSLIEP